MQKNYTLVILAAGMGSRYGGLKQLDAIGPNGETLSDYNIYNALQTGCNDVLFVLREDIVEDFKDIFVKRWENKINIRYTIQRLNDIPSPYKVPMKRTKPWGTGHALLAAKGQIEQPFSVINADDFYDMKAFQQLQTFFSTNTSQNTFTNITYVLKNTLSNKEHDNRGVCKINKNNELIDMREFLDIYHNQEGDLIGKVDDKYINLTGEELVSIQLWGFYTTFFPFLEKEFAEFLEKKGQELKSEFLIPDIVGAGIRQKKFNVKIYQTNAKWFGITYPKDREKAQKKIQELIKAGIYPEKL